MENTIKKLVEQTPNDLELGGKIRALYYKEKGINEVQVDPNQITLDQLIIESENN